MTSMPRRSMSGRFCMMTMGEQAIATADVQHLGVLWEEVPKVVTKHPHPPSMDISSMKSFDEAHLRRMPRMLMKKLERTV